MSQSCGKNHPLFEKKIQASKICKSLVLDNLKIQKKQSFFIHKRKQKQSKFKSVSISIDVIRSKKYHKEQESFKNQLPAISIKI